MNRRRFLQTAAAAVPAGAALSIEAPPGLRGKAEHCIFLWLGGGMAQMDTFDPKALGSSAAKKPGSYYAAIGTAVSGVQVCEHLPQTARLLDRMTILRTVNHEVVDEHAAAAQRMHTGRLVSGTVQYPSIGSLVSATRGRMADGVPPYVVCGYPSPMRGPGFLGAAHGYLYLTDTESGPAGLVRPEDVSPERQLRRDELLAELRESARKAGSSNTRDYDAAIDEARRLSGPDFLPVFDLKQEPAALRAAYGGEFGQRCLLARRLVQRGVRFVEVAHNLNFVNGTGWDTHNEGQLNQHILIRELDAALSTLVTDLESARLLDRTLVVVATEFGRPPDFDAGGGRGHHPKAFSCVLAGAGLKHRGAWGQTDDVARTIVADPVSAPGFFATILAALGVDPAQVLKDRNDRPVPVTDNGQAVAALF